MNAKEKDSKITQIKEGQEHPPTLLPKKQTPPPDTHQSVRCKLLMPIFCRHACIFLLCKVYHGHFKVHKDINKISGSCLGHGFKNWLQFKLPSDLHIPPILIYYGAFRWFFLFKEGVIGLYVTRFLGEFWIKIDFFFFKYLMVQRLR